MSNPMLIKDELIIFAKAGNGGNGAISFRREKYLPKGGPDGGNGGKGGDVIIVCNANLSDLQHIRNGSKMFAQPGESGGKAKKMGKKGQSLKIFVPPGTSVFNAETKCKICELTSPMESFVLEKGGSGGAGNTQYKSSVNQIPRKAGKGQETKIQKIRLELRYIANTGLIGFPNAGKSTLLRKLSSAKPITGAYPFTTLNPQIGTIFVSEWESFSMADLPGIEQGASSGTGLGYLFLKHITHVSSLIFVLNINQDPCMEFKILISELKKHSPSHLLKPFFVILNKKDLITKNMAQIKKEQFIEFGQKLYANFQTNNVFIMSGLFDDNLMEFKMALFQSLKTPDNTL